MRLINKSSGEQYFIDLFEKWWHYPLLALTWFIPHKAYPYKKNNNSIPVKFKFDFKMGIVTGLSFILADIARNLKIFSFSEEYYWIGRVFAYPISLLALIITWRYFSNFKKWMETQVWKGLHLDKDLLGSGMLYSPETCCFVPQSINNLLTTRENYRGLFPLGVYKSDGKKPFKATCNTGRGRVYLGRFACPLEAHKAWQTEKVRVIVELTAAWAASEQPPREEIVNALLNKAGKIQADILEGKLTENF